MMDILPPLPDTESKSLVSMTQSSTAGIYDALLRGNNNSVADREAAHKIQKVMPDVLSVVKENESFLHRCISYMLRHGVRQFIDIGSGFITSEDIHILVHSVDPKATVVYVDKNPAVIEAGNKLLAAAKGPTSIVCADISQTQDVFVNPDLISRIDFTQPVFVSMMFVTCFFTDSEIKSIMSVIKSKISDDSYVAITQETLDGHKDELEKVARVQEVFENTSMPLKFRNRTETSQILQGFHLVDPGLVFVNEWHIELDLPAPAPVQWLYGGLAKKGALQSLPSMNLQIYANIMRQQPWKNLNTKALSLTSLMVIIWCFFTTLAQSILDTGALYTAIEGYGSELKRS